MAPILYIGASYRLLLSTFVLHLSLTTSEEYQICINRSSPEITDEQRLLISLMAEYDKSTRPVFNASHPVKVYLGITLTQVFDVEWEDEKIQWNPEEYNNLTVLRIPCNKLWLPDIVLYNSADDYTHGYMQALAMVKSNGYVFWPPIVKLRSTCQIDITYFPFDDQICRMKLGSWAYDGFQVDVHHRLKAIDLENYVSNGEWELIDVKVKRNVVKYACCKEPFPDVTFFIHIRRRTLYYTYNVIIPCIMLSTLTLMGFWMRPDSGEKVTLGLTVLLAFSVFMLLIAENMPATSNFVPLVGIYLTVIMALTSLSVILAVFVSNINNRGYRQSKLPRSLRTFIVLASRFVCYKLEYIQKIQYEEIKLSNFQVVVKSRSRKTFSCQNPSESGCNLVDYENGDQNGNRNGDGINNRRPDAQQGWEADEILKKLQALLSKEEEKGLEVQVMREWQEVAEVIDRLLFWVFILATLLCSVVILILVPLAKSHKKIDISD